MRKFFKIILLIALFLGADHAFSQQNPNNPLLYSNQAILFGDQGSPHDPVTVIMPGTAYAAGFGSFLDNPASAALFGESFGEFGLSFRMVDEEAEYINSFRSLDDNQTTLSNAGFVYSFPTRQGSFVIGAGYNQHTIYNRALGVNARNEQNTITDEFKWNGSPYQEIAYNAFATDIGDDVGDWDESILRIGFDDFGDFLGMRQRGEIIQRGYGGEYSVFFATEFQENFMVGASLGILSGSFRYNRAFLEIDDENFYNSDIIETEAGGTDIDTILLGDQLRSRYTGLRARVGAIVRLSDNIQIGGSYTLPTRIHIDEEFDARIETTFDNGELARDEDFFDFSYRVSYPSRTSLGLSFIDLSGLSLSLAADYVNYSNTTIDFDDSSLLEDEQIENEFIENTFRPVWSFRGGLAYDVTPDFTLRGGFSYLPSRFREGDDNRNIFSLGAGFTLSRGVRLELAGQYAIWDEVSTVYDYAEFDYSPLPDNQPSTNFRSQEASRSVDRWNVMATLRFGLY